ncbi:MAG: hypothetical protein YPKNTGVA_001833 [Candidatus Fervidibacter sp.]|jgi:hypothetical protein
MEAEILQQKPCRTRQEAMGTVETAKAEGKAKEVTESGGDDATGAK